MSVESVDSSAQERELRWKLGCHLCSKEMTTVWGYSVEGLWRALGKRKGKPLSGKGIFNTMQWCDECTNVECNECVQRREGCLTR